MIYCEYFCVFSIFVIIVFSRNTLQNYYKFYEFRKPKLCFIAYFRNLFTQHAINLRITRFIYGFVTFRKSLKMPNLTETHQMHTKDALISILHPPPLSSVLLRSPPLSSVLLSSPQFSSVLLSSPQFSSALLHPFTSPLISPTHFTSF